MQHETQYAPADNASPEIIRAINRADGIADHAGELVGLAEAVAAQLFGQEPATAAQGEEAPVPSVGIVGRIHAELARCERNLVELQHHLERLAHETSTDS